MLGELWGDESDDVSAAAEDAKLQRDGSCKVLQWQLLMVVARGNGDARRSGTGR